MHPNVNGSKEQEVLSCKIKKKKFWLYASIILHYHNLREAMRDSLNKQTKKKAQNQKSSAHSALTSCLNSLRLTHFIYNVYDIFNQPELCRLDTDMVHFKLPCKL